MAISREEIDKILGRYGKKLEKQINPEEVAAYRPSQEFSREYSSFKQEFLDKSLTTYESLCKSAYGILKVNAKPKDYNKLQKNIDMAHLDITPDEAASFATLVVFLGIIASLIFGGVSWFVFDSLAALWAIPVIMVGVLLIGPLSRLPNYFGDRYRLKASDQMVMFVLYLVIYMRHTSNLEYALKFASDHTRGNLALDFRKVFWDVETNKYSSLKESIDNYLISWRDYNLDFVNSIHLIESSLYEPKEERRVVLLEKSLENILQSSYDKMLAYAHGLNNPITMIHMLGVILPILGLVILPLITSFIQNVSISTKATALILIYNIVVPLAVLYAGLNVLSKRPSGYGITSLKYELKSHKFGPILLFVIFALIGLFPVVFHYLSPGIDYDLGILGDFLGYYDGLGPYGVGAVIVGLFLPLGLGLALSLKNKLDSGKYVEQREELKKLESEFSSSLFQLGNRVGEGIPVEAAFGKVAETMQGTPTGNFFSRIDYNIRRQGMNVSQAIFDRESGAIINYPSPFVESSMEVLVEGAKKSPEVVSQSLISISNYSNNVKKVNERLKDLLADILASMKSQINFMAPVIGGVVVGIATMIVSIMGRLKGLILGADTGQGLGISQFETIAELFDVTAAVPSYYFQLIVGFYIVEIVIVLTILSNNLENGFDKVSEKSQIGKNLFKSVLLYTVIAGIVTFLFTLVANVALQGIAGA